MSRPSQTRPTTRPAARGIPPQGSSLFGSDPNSVIGPAISEFIGTLLLTLAVLSASVHGVPGIAVAAIAGLTLFALISMFGNVSGGHFNPLVTLGLAAAREFPVAVIPVYVVAQVLGAIVAALLVRWTTSSTVLHMLHLGTPAPASDSSPIWAFVFELIGGFILGSAVARIATTPNLPTPLAGLGIGAGLAVAAMIAGPISGGAVNTALALGPMIVSGHLTDILVYTGSIFGGIIGFVLFDRVLRHAMPPTKPSHT